MAGDSMGFVSMGFGKRLACALAVFAAAGCSSGPSGPPGIYNNNDHPVTVEANGIKVEIQPLDTVHVSDGTVWTVPPQTYCTWHYGFGGGNPYFAGQQSRVVIHHRITIEGCASSAARMP